MEDDWQDALFSRNVYTAQLLNSGYGADCRFVVGKVSFPAHKSLLSNTSPVFDRIFNEIILERGAVTIVVDDIEAPVFKNMLNFIYTDNADIKSITKAFQLYKPANTFMLSQLKRKCVNYLRQNLSPSNVCKILKFSQLYNENSLRISCMTVIREKTSAVIACDSFYRADLSVLKDILSESELAISNELELFNALQRYAENRYPSYRLSIAKIEKKIITGELDFDYDSDAETQTDNETKISMKIKSADISKIESVDSETNSDAKAKTDTETKISKKLELELPTYMLDSETDDSNAQGVTDNETTISNKLQRAAISNKETELPSYMLDSETDDSNAKRETDKETKISMKIKSADISKIELVDSETNSDAKTKSDTETKISKKLELELPTYMLDSETEDSNAQRVTDNETTISNKLQRAAISIKETELRSYMLDSETDDSNAKRETENETKISKKMKSVDISKNELVIIIELDDSKTDSVAKTQTDTERKSSKKQEMELPSFILDSETDDSNAQRETDNAAISNKESSSDSKIDTEMFLPSYMLDTDHDSTDKQIRISLLDSENVSSLTQTSEDFKHPYAPISSEGSSSENNEDPTAILLYLMKLIKAKIRFLTMTAREFAEGPAMSGLLRPADILAMSLCLIDRYKTNEKFPEGFSGEMKNRSSLEITIQKEKLLCLNCNEEMKCRICECPQYLENYLPPPASNGSSKSS